ncbi:MAG: tryptophan--tRNA ligase [Ktedonobacterales bacterium]
MGATTTQPRTGDTALPRYPQRPRVFSGIAPSGVATLGNYIGAIRYWVADQDVYDNIFCVVDLHAITLPQDPDVLRENTRQLAAVLLACGIDPARSELFIQSQVSAHAEMAWLLGCLTPLGWLNRMTQFKSKAADARESASAGLYTYPVLMAADILLYHTQVVPVGDDQVQHVELTRDLANSFNFRFGETFTEPKALIREVGARIMALDDPTKKMSKSGAVFASISLLDAPEVVRKKIARATTDSERTIVFDERRPGVFNLLTIYQALGSETPEQIEAQFAGKGYKEFKQALAERINGVLAPIQTRYAQIVAQPGELDRVLAAGAARVRPLAEQTLRDAKQKVGLLL